uniref:Histone deacetylase complex subunit SAP30 Sin3 binding domain-containing protein n=1 Tax=Oryza punctata TaxID=4537 RepID=A0A0E0M6U7_ORYPU
MITSNPADPPKTRSNSEQARKKSQSKQSKNTNQSPKPGRRPSTTPPSYPENESSKSHTHSATPTTTLLLLHSALLSAPIPCGFSLSLSLFSNSRGLGRRIGAISGLGLLSNCGELWVLVGRSRRWSRRGFRIVWFWGDCCDRDSASCGCEDGRIEGELERILGPQCLISDSWEVHSPDWCDPGVNFGEFLGSRIWPTVPARNRGNWGPIWCQLGRNSEAEAIDPTGEMIAAVGRGPEGWGEDEMSVLPRHTKVVVTGNNRTKSVLVGLHGVVKKAVGLGGWHWLVLTNGIEVKLQRNALSVIEPPTGNEDDDKFDCENMQWNSSDLASDDAQSPKPQRSRSRQHRGFQTKSFSRSMSCDSHSKASFSSSSRAHTKVDLNKLEMTALWRYWRHFNLDASPNPSREQLVDAVQRHFVSQVDKQDSSPANFYTAACITMID